MQVAPCGATTGEWVIRLAGMIWHIAGPPDFLSVRAGQPARVSVLTPRPGFLFADCARIKYESAAQRSGSASCRLCLTTKTW